jgi:hypothetical protein
LSIPLQASRRGNDRDGRLYQILIRAIDAAGNQSTVSLEVLVPHDAK